jgi:molecular chaperone HscB
MTNYFQLFELPVDFDIELAVLEQHYFVLQNKFHPDRYINSGPEVKNEAMRHSILLNEGYNTLKDDFKRAEHLLSLCGINIDEGEKLVAPDILMEVMDLQEQLIDVNLEQRNILIKDVVGKIKVLYNDFSHLYKRVDLEAAHQVLLKIKYYSKII